MPTNVCLSVDLECTIGGAFRDHALLPLAEPAFMCTVAGRSEGLGFLLDVFRANGITATFFLEALHGYYFRHSPLREAAQRVVAEGHEVQLHAHPCWSVFGHTDWRARAQSAGLDDFFGRSVNASVALIQAAQAFFAEWNLPQPTVFRAGNLQHDDNLFAALASCQIPYSSSVGVGVFNSGDPRYQLYSGHHLRHGVVELPVLSFGDRHLWGERFVKTLTITGTSFQETRALLESAERSGIENVVLLTHPNEFVQKSDDQFSVTRRNAVNQRRLVRLCNFLRDESVRFPTIGLAHAARAVTAHPSSDNLLLHTRQWPSLVRKATNLVYDRYGQAALGRLAGKPQALRASVVARQ
jgi:hypothetical protein